MSVLAAIPLGAACGLRKVCVKPATHVVARCLGNLRQLVGALQSLREQRAADLVALRSAREALRRCAALAEREVTGATEVDELMWELRVVAGSAIS